MSDARTSKTDLAAAAYAEWLRCRSPFRSGAFEAFHDGFAAGLRAGETPAECTCPVVTANHDVACPRYEPKTSDECPKCCGTGAQDRPYQIACERGHPGPFRDEHGYYEKRRLPETKAALDRVLVCLEHRKGENYRVQVREGQSERFWTELADALVERRALKTPPEPRP